MLSGLVSVFKLLEPLAASGEVAIVIYILQWKGCLLLLQVLLYKLNEQVIRQNLQAIQSEALRCGLDHTPSMAFVGTHPDLQHNCTETPDEKDDIQSSRKRDAKIRDSKWWLTAAGNIPYQCQRTTE